MYEEKKYGLTFIVDARVELIHAILSKLKKEYKKFPNLTEKNYDEELDFIEVCNTDYAKKFYELIDFNKNPELLKWAEKLADLSDCGMTFEIAMMFDENFNKQIERVTSDHNEDPDFIEFLEEFSAFEKTIQEFIKKSRYIEFYNENHKEFHKMIEDASSEYPENLDMNDMKEFYGLTFKKHPVIYSQFYNGGIGFEIEKTPHCFKGLWIEDGKYFESTNPVVHLFHEYSHPIINPLVDKYWENFENKENLLENMTQNGLVEAYQKNKTIYYEYFVRAVSDFLGKKYIDIHTRIEIDKELGFTKIEELIEHIEKEYNMDGNFEKYFKEKLIPYINELTSKSHKKRRWSYMAKEIICESPELILKKF